MSCWVWVSPAAVFENLIWKMHLQNNLMNGAPCCYSSPLMSPPAQKAFPPAPLMMMMSVSSSFSHFWRETQTKRDYLQEQNYVKNVCFCCAPGIDNNLKRLEYKINSRLQYLKNHWSYHDTTHYSTAGGGMVSWVYHYIPTDITTFLWHTWIWGKIWRIMVRLRALRTLGRFRVMTPALLTLSSETSASTWLDIWQVKMVQRRSYLSQTQDGAMMTL